MPTLTPPGCGRCARPDARSLEPSPTSSISSRTTPPISSPSLLLSTRPGWRRTILTSSPDCRRQSPTAGSSRLEACGWSLTPTCLVVRRCAVSCCTGSGTSWRSSATTAPRCGCLIPSVTREPYRSWPNWLAPSGS